MNPTFYDSDILSSFLIVDKTNLLKKIFKKIIIPEQVFYEITNPLTPDFVKKEFKRLISEKYIEIMEPEKDDNVKKIYDVLKEKMGKGESSVLSLAIINNGIPASNNIKDVLPIVKKYNLSLITSSILLVKLHEKEILTKNDANTIWKKMLEKNRKLPSKSFSEYYAKQFKKDFKEFNCKEYYNTL